MTMNIIIRPRIRLSDFIYGVLCMNGSRSLVVLFNNKNIDQETIIHGG